MGEESYPMPRGLHWLLLVARITSALIAAVLVLMMVGYATNQHGSISGPDDSTLWLHAFFPIGMCLGYVIAWRRPLIGGIVSVACIVFFLVALGEADMIVLVSILGIPGLGFIAYELLRKRYENERGPREPHQPPA